MIPIGYIEKGGKRHEIFHEDEKRRGWTFVAGQRIPGPDEIAPEVERRLEQEIIEDIKKDPRWVARKIAIENEVRNG